MDRVAKIEQLGKRVRFRAGQKIYAKGAPATHLFIVVSGELLTTAASPDGREIVFYRMDASYGPAPLTALLDGAIYENDCVAQNDCELIVVKVAAFRGLLREDAALALHFLQIALQRLSRRTQRWEDASLLKTGARICKWIVEYASERGGLSNGSVLELNDTERLIGLSLGGVSRESVSRHLVALEIAGIIGRSPKKIAILNASKLQALAYGTEPFQLDQRSFQKHGKVLNVFEANRAPRRQSIRANV